MDEHRVNVELKKSKQAIDKKALLRLKRHYEQPLLQQSVDKFSESISDSVTYLTHCGVQKSDL